MDGSDVTAGLGKALAALVAVPVVALLLLLAINSRDEAPSADAARLAAMLRERPALADAANGYVHGTGCNFCAHTGYLERIGVYELLVVTDEIREMVIDRVPHEDMRKMARTQGMRTLQEQAVRLVEQGVTTAAEVMRSIYVAGV